MTSAIIWSGTGNGVYVTLHDVDSIMRDGDTANNVIDSFVEMLRIEQQAKKPGKNKPFFFSSLCWKYQPYALDPNLSSALASVRWELNLLSKHHHLPTVSTLALTISTLSNAQNQQFTIGAYIGGVVVNDSILGCLWVPKMILLFVNGKVCNDPKLATADDFFFSGLLTPQNTSNPIGSKVTPVNVIQILGLNTLGISLARIDFAPYGLNPPHTHPRATEVIVVLEGTLYVGFVTSNTDNRLFTKVLYPGDVFVFPQGLIHFQFNNGKTNAVALAALSSQNPGTITVANAVFGSNPRISDDVLAKAFQVDKKVVDYLQAQFWWPSN
ncbi:hypothetical protein TEA_009587 [Camellia sinensis var. sinensis]|uniref:Cupin type-1 domain-containing protein n=1 Tax=Camellia sinensis var. sinensis TaxID=542762 RepID=A0A4S4DX04_CAMSN|nr:hypothetical protein TEA_009587 [Camellia sinensis var. sinensis]